MLFAQMHDELCATILKTKVPKKYHGSIMPDANIQCLPCVHQSANDKVAREPGNNILKSGALLNWVEE